MHQTAATRLPTLQAISENQRNRGAGVGGSGAARPRLTAFDLSVTAVVVLGGGGESSSQQLSNSRGEKQGDIWSRSGAKSTHGYGECQFVANY